MKCPKFGALLLLMVVYCSATHRPSIENTMETLDHMSSIPYSTEPTFDESMAAVSSLHRETDFTFSPSEETPTATDDPLSYLFDHTILTRNEINLDHASTLKYRTTGVPPEDIYHSTLPPMDKPTIAKGTAKKSNYLETIIKNAKMVVNMTGQYRKFGADRVTMDISSNHAVDSRSSSLSTEARDHSVN